MTAIFSVGILGSFNFSVHSKRCFDGTWQCQR